MSLLTDDDLSMFKRLAFSKMSTPNAWQDKII